MVGAEQSVAALRKTALEDDTALGRRIGEARAVRDEVSFLVERADALAEKLEYQIDAGRPVERKAANPVVASGPAARLHQCGSNTSRTL